LWFFALTFVIECLVASSALFVRYHQMGGSFRSWRWEKARAAGLLRESCYEIFTQFALLLLLRVDSIMVQAMRGEAEAGYYGAAVRVSEVAYFLPMMLAGFMLPPMMQRKQRAASDYRERMADYFGITIAFTLPIAAVVAFASDGIIRLLFGAAFLPAAPILCIHAWALIPFALGVARTQYLTLERRLHANVPAVFAALVINIGLNLLWIPAHGGIGAAWATLIAYSCAWVVSSPFMAGTREISSLMVLGVVRLPLFLRDTLSRLRNRPPLAPPPVSR
jgi:PST family polysaccharide transporter